MTESRFCSECKWMEDRRAWPDKLLGLFGVHTFSALDMYCTHPESMFVHTDIVTGRTFKNAQSCSTSRIDAPDMGACGTEGKLWEPK